MENLVTANGKCQDHLPRWDRKQTSVLVQLGVKDGCQVLWLLESWLARHVSRCQRGIPRSSAPCHPSPPLDRLLLLMTAVYRGSA